MLSSSSSSSSSSSLAPSFGRSLLLIWLLLLPCRIGRRCVKAAMQCTAKATAVAVAAGGTAVAHSVVGHYSVILYELDKYTAHTHSVRGREGGREIPSKTWWVVGPISFNTAQQKGEREAARERKEGERDATWIQMRYFSVFISCCTFSPSHF